RKELAVAHLPREAAGRHCEETMREKLILELEEERRLRVESQKRLQEVTQDRELGRAQMVSLQQQFSRWVQSWSRWVQSWSMWVQSWSRWPPRSSGLIGPGPE
ncbi:unnamed protein product, partial [Tetraodon nigroviridis]